MVAHGGLPVFKTEREHIIQAFLNIFSLDSASDLRELEFPNPNHYLPD